jgi:hypothetical protein
MGRTVIRGAALAVVPDVEPGEAELVEEMTKAEAEKITDEIRAGLQDWYALTDRVTQLALTAYKGQAFTALGYQSWNDYAAAQFGDLELPRTTQAAINAALINTGQISARSAAAISGTSDKTAAADAAKAQGATAESSAVGKQRIGADGKQRAARKPPVRPKATDYDKVTQAAQAAGWKVEIWRQTKTNLDIGLSREGAASKACFFDMPAGRLSRDRLASVLDYLQNPQPAKVTPIRPESRDGGPTKPAATKPKAAESDRDLVMRVAQANGWEIKTLSEAGFTVYKMEAARLFRVSRGSREVELRFTRAGYLERTGKDLAAVLQILESPEANAVPVETEPTDPVDAELPDDPAPAQNSGPQDEDIVDADWSDATETEPKSEIAQPQGPDPNPFLSAAPSGDWTRRCQADIEAWVMHPHLTAQHRKSMHKFLSKMLRALENGQHW